MHSLPAFIRSDECQLCTQPQVLSQQIAYEQKRLLGFSLFQAYYQKGEFSVPPLHIVFSMGEYFYHGKNRPKQKETTLGIFQLYSINSRRNSLLSFQVFYCGPFWQLQFFARVLLSSEFKYLPGWTKENGPST